MEWKQPSVELPKNGSNVRWMTSKGEIVIGTYSNRLWFVGDMYVYYTPTYWTYDE